MTERLTLTLTVAVRAPFLFPGLTGLSLGVDAGQLRDESGNPVVPAAQIKGLLREALGDLADAAPAVVTRAEIDLLFGALSPDSSDGEAFDRPVRGCAILADLVAPGLPAGTARTTRVEIDDATGAAATGHLQVIELVAPFGMAVEFTGSMVVFWPRETSTRLVAAIDRAIRVIPALGAFKTSGFGAVIEDRSGATLAETRTLTVPAAARDRSDRCGFAFTLDRPYLVDARRVADNAFAGSDIIPGSVVKGALAQTLALTAGNGALSEYGAALSALRLSHAWPEDAAGGLGGERLPLSTVAAKPSTGLCFGDALMLPDRPNGANEPMRGPRLAGEAATFPVDWKEGWEAAARQALGIAHYVPPSALPRTHTAIGDRGIAANQQLFTMLARSALCSEYGQHPRRFLMTADVSGVPEPERERARRLVALMAAGLDGIGRTGATARFERWAAGDAIAAVRPVRGFDDLFAVVLRTDSVMTDPRTPQDAREAYQAYWREVTGGNAELVDFCATQHLAGGYLATRYRPWGATYHPFVVTDAGSVFLLRGPIRAWLEQLTASGLPLPAFEGAAPLDWRNCPFTPENGFGSIRANHLSSEVEREWSHKVEHV